MENPYAAPEYREEPAQKLPVEEAQPLRALVRWAVICTACAIPSFIWGCVLHSEWQHIAGMVTGIAVFILLYTGIECSHAYRRVAADARIRRTLRIGYGTRIAMSLVFPVGMFFDVYTGMLSVALIEGRAMAGESQPPSFFIVLLTTLVQGVLVNLVLCAYMLVVYGIQWTFAKATGAPVTVATGADSA